jgi:hypothetical protein
VSATVETIVQEALALVGDVAGPSVQTYGEDQMLNEVVRGFNILFKKYHWHQYREWFRLELDGTTGIINSDGLTTVLDFEDFISVHRDTIRSQLPILPESFNPYTLTSGTTVKYWTSLAATNANYAARKLQFYPLTSTGFINVHARVYPIAVGEEWDMEDTMYLDKDMLVYCGAYMTLVGDDLNPGAADTCKNLMEMKYKDIINSFASQPIAVEGDGSIPTEWTECR